MKLYAVAIVTNHENVDWEFVGIFDDKQKALDCCYDENCFIGPCKLNVEMPREKHDWIGAWYPALEEEPKT